MMIFAFFFFTDGGCKNTIHSTFFSPDQKHKIVLHNYDCGATTGFSTHISLIESDEMIDGAGNTFVADDDHGKARSHPSFDTLIDVNIEWLDNRTVKITYDKLARVFEEDERVDGIDIKYVRK
ncbi:hypothetical protein [Dyadobacter sp. CY312]|uniref:hypothetical protein n=1 Tax=Dyadobacter sp. CY312 TaxID=2907303 RepID=UPI001F446264|nr:hypothetical protein [Dyadobacter sp. CY312]MCE7044147.1 hypothetical protein [Dyadobacter sp. CY312]